MKIKYGKMICPRCGAEMDVVCNECGFPVTAFRFNYVKD